MIAGWMMGVFVKVTSEVQWCEFLLPQPYCWKALLVEGVMLCLYLISHVCKLPVTAVAKCHQWGSWTQQRLCAYHCGSELSETKVSARPRSLWGLWENLPWPLPSSDVFLTVRCISGLGNTSLQSFLQHHVAFSRCVSVFPGLSS